MFVVSVGKVSDSGGGIAGFWGVIVLKPAVFCFEIVYDVDIIVGDLNHSVIGSHRMGLSLCSVYASPILRRCASTDVSIHLFQVGISFPLTAASVRVFSPGSLAPVLFLMRT